MTKTLRNLADDNTSFHPQIKFSVNNQSQTMTVIIFLALWLPHTEALAQKPPQVNQVLIVQRSYLEGAAKTVSQLEFEWRQEIEQSFRVCQNSNAIGASGSDFFKNGEAQSSYFQAVLLTEKVMNITYPNPALQDSSLEGNFTTIVDSEAFQERFKNIAFRSKESTDQALNKKKDALAIAVGKGLINAMTPSQRRYKISQALRLYLDVCLMLPAAREIHADIAKMFTELAERINQLTDTIGDQGLGKPPAVAGIRIALNGPGSADVLFPKAFFELKLPDDPEAESTDFGPPRFVNNPSNNRRVSQSSESSSSDKTTGADPSSFNNPAGSPAAIDDAVLLAAMGQLGSADFLQGLLTPEFLSALPPGTSLAQMIAAIQSKGSKPVYRQTLQNFNKQEIQSKKSDKPIALAKVNSDCKKQNDQTKPDGQANSGGSQDESCEGELSDAIDASLFQSFLKF